jgi:hypothetical protein
MKNIHIIPTEKPSELYINMQGILSKSNSLLLRLKSRHIYITSDEKIKEGDYGLIGKDIGKIIINGDGYEFLMGVAISYEYADFYYLQEVCKKIVLTTDQDLIKDGVQSIPDEFLEWFVKNPSCESVEVILYLKSITNPITNEDYPTVQYRHFDLNKMICKYEYKIIIPKEEVKQYSKYLSCCRSKEECYCKELPQFGTKEFYTFFSDLCDKNLGGKPSTKLHKGEVVDKSYPKEFKQETLEEAAVKYSNNFTGDEGKFAIEDFINGVKWQQERMYSETEVLQLLLRLQQTESYNNLYEWFEQNKKK